MMLAHPTHEFVEYHRQWECFHCLGEWAKCSHGTPPWGPCPRDLGDILIPDGHFRLKEFNRMRIAFTDGEMSNLDANFGQLLCACIVEYKAPRPGSPLSATNPPWTNMRTFALTNYSDKRWDDRGLAKDWRNALEDYDIIVTWNGIKFDIPFLNTRLLARWHERELRSPRHKDLMYTARFKLRMNNATLDNVAQTLGIGSKYGVAKTPMRPAQWTMAMGGHRPSYNYILRHCQNDVKVLAGVWQEIKHLAGEIK